MSNLYVLTSEVENLYKQIENSIDEETGEIDIDLSNALAVKDEEFNSKAVAVAVVSRRFGSTVEEIDAEIKRLTAMKQRYKSAQERLKNSLSDACLRLGRNKIEGIGAVISFRASEKTVVDNEEELDEKFINVTMVKKPDLTKIKEAIKNGESVKGAHIESSLNIQIK